MLTAKELTYQYFLQKTNDFLPLSKIADVVAGIFTHTKEVFVLDDFTQTTDASIGYSRRLHNYVEIEPDIAMPLLKSNEDIAFMEGLNKGNQRGLVLFEIKGSIHDEQNFLMRHPALSDYIRKCDSFCNAKTKDLRPYKVNVLNPKQSDILLNAKHVLLIKDNVCQSFFDKNGTFAIPKEMYGIRMKKLHSLSNGVMTAIFNSSFFAYIRMCDSKINKDLRNSKYESVCNCPIPAYTSSQNLVKAIEILVECLASTKRYRQHSVSSEKRLERYLLQMMDMAVFNLYLPDYMTSKGLSVAEDFDSYMLLTDFMPADERAKAVYDWYMTPENKVRQKIMLLDSRSPDLLYTIKTYSQR